MEFKLKTKLKPKGDQPEAIKKLAAGLELGHKWQTLLGVTGSGKTFSVANVIEKWQKPALIVAHNKTLAAQLCNELRDLFPDNAVEYFVSYYDYYQPESYMPSTDTYIEKEAQINQEIDRLRHSATQALLSRSDVIVVASVSCIYGLGQPANYFEQALALKKGQKMGRSQLIRQLIKLGFLRSPTSLSRGHFRVRGSVFEIMPVSQEIIWRFSLKSGQVGLIQELDPITRKPSAVKPGLSRRITIFPARHFVTKKDEQETALKKIERDLEKRLKYFRGRSKLLEAQRLERRVRQDLEMIRQVGYCSGIENYSRYFDGRSPGEPPFTLLDYLPDEFLLVIDESHMTIPQIRGMFNGDRARKNSLVKHGFRLPAARDNRPLKFNEFLGRLDQVICMSATPSAWEKDKSWQVVEQVVRPTGLVDPKIEIRPIMGEESQVENLVEEIKKRAKKKERVLATTLTKKMAEDLSDYLKEHQVRAKYLHSDIKTLQRIKILNQFRKGEFDCLVGVNLLREGLDLPEVTLVAILDADKEGFLRSKTSLIQTMGRAARNVLGEVILYADEETGSISQAVEECRRRRQIQLDYNKRYDITPETVSKEIRDITKLWGIKEEKIEDILETELVDQDLSKKEIKQLIKKKQKEMRQRAHDLDFETAALLRDEIKTLRKSLE